MIRHRHRILTALLCAPLVWAAHSSGAITASTKQSTSPAVIEPVVQAFISGELGRLQGKNAAAQKAAKDALIAESTGHGDIIPTAEYQQTYARVLAQQLQPLTKNPVLRVRLLAAIVAGQVAADTVKSNGPGEFESLAMVLINDKEDAVVLRGVELAKYVIGALAVQGKSPASLDKAVIAAVKNHPDRGYFAEEAYSALTLEPYPDSLGKAAPVVLQDLLALMNERTAQYATAPPPSPQAEEKATKFLAVDANSAASAPGVRNQVLKALGEGACAVLNQIAQGNNSPEMVSAARAFGGALQVFGNNASNQPLQLAGQAIYGVGANTPSNTVNASCNTLVNALKAMGVQIKAPAGVDQSAAGGQ